MITLMLLAACERATPPKPVDSDPAVDTDTTPDTDLPDDTDPTTPPPTCGPGVTVLGDATGYADLQDALDAASDGATLTLCPGTHSGRFWLRRDLTLTLQGQTGDPADTIIKPFQPGEPTLDVDADTVHLTVRHLTLREAMSEPLVGALGVRVDRLSDSSLRVEDCVFADNVDGFLGTALSTVNVADVTLVDTVFRDNHAGNGPPVYLENVRRSLSVLGCTFQGNQGNPVGALGVYRDTWETTPLDVRVEDSVFVDNTVDDGALATALHIAIDAPAPTTISLLRNQFINNHQSAVAFNPVVGGTVTLAQRTGTAPLNALIDDCTFDGNTHDRGAHLALTFPSQTIPSTVDIVSSRFWRGDWTGFLEPVDDGTFPETGAAIFAYRLFRDPPALTVNFTEVDFGAGPTANARQDIAYCETDYEGVVSGTLDLDAGDPCLTP